MTVDLEKTEIEFLVSMLGQITVNASEPSNVSIIANVSGIMQKLQFVLKVATPEAAGSEVPAQE